MSDTASIIGLIPGRSFRLTIPLRNNSSLVVDCLLKSLDEELLRLQPDLRHFSQSDCDWESSWTLVHDHFHCLINHVIEPISLQEDGTILARWLTSSCLKKTRTTERVELTLKIRQWPAGTSWARLHKTEQQTVTLNRNGLQFISSHPLYKHQCLLIELSKPGSTQETLVINIEVVETKPTENGFFQVAARFISLSEQDRDLLDRWSLSGHFLTLHQRIQRLGQILSPVDQGKDDHVS